MKGIALSSVEQIVAVLKQAEFGMPVADYHSPGRDLGSPRSTAGKKQYAGPESDQVRELKQLQDENARLSHGRTRPPAASARAIFLN